MAFKDFPCPLSHSSLLVDTALHTPFSTQTSVSIIQSLCHIGLLSLLFSLPGTPSIYHGRIPQWLRVWKTLPCTSCMTIGKWISPSEPQFPHLKYGHNTSIIWLSRDNPYPVPGTSQELNRWYCFCCCYKDGTIIICSHLHSNFCFPPSSVLVVGNL